MLLPEKRAGAVDVFPGTCADERAGIRRRTPYPFALRPTPACGRALQSDTMRWHKTTLISIYGLLGQAAAPSKASTEARVQEVRLAMLEALAQAGLDARHPHLVWRIQYADDAYALWHLRSDMMTLLAAELGEAQAWQVVDRLSDRFEGLLPRQLLASAKARRRPTQ